MLFIDNIYYIFCCLYRKTKESRIEDSWRVGGGTVTALYLGVSLFLFLSPYIDSFEFNYKSSLKLSIMGVTAIIVTIRYSIFCPFDKLEDKIKNMNPKKRKNLNFWTYLFLFTCLPIAITYAYYLK